MPMARKKTDPLDPAVERELLRELTLLRDELCSPSMSACPPMAARTNLGLFRIFSGVDINQWREISHRLNLTGWQTLPIDRDIYPHLTVLQENLERLSYESEHDALTGLANRRAFKRFLDLEIERTRRGRTALSLAIMDLDDFKRINDEHGHPVGDEVLVRVGRIISAEKRRYDQAARIGGEEFALVVPGAGQVRTRAMVERMLELLSRERFTTPEGATFSVTFSAGIVSYRGNSERRVDELMEKADKALYEAKQQGKSRVKLAPLPDLDTVPRESLVQASEKKFLFTGKK